MTVLLTHDYDEDNLWYVLLKCNMWKIPYNDDNDNRGGISIYFKECYRNLRGFKF